VQEVERGYGIPVISVANLDDLIATWKQSGTRAQPCGGHGIPLKIRVTEPLRALGSRITDMRRHLFLFLLSPPRRSGAGGQILLRLDEKALRPAATCCRRMYAAYRE